MRSSADLAGSASPRAIALAALQALLIATAAAAAALTGDPRDWEPVSLVVWLLALTGAGQLLLSGDGVPRVGPSVSLTVLAIVLLGPGVAALVAAAGVGAWWLRARVTSVGVIDALVAQVAVAVAAAVAWHATGVAGDGWQLAAAICLLYLSVSSLNFVLVAGALSIREGRRVLGAVRALYVRALPWELVTGVLTGLTVIAYQRLGITALVALVLGVGVARRLAASVARVLDDRHDERAQAQRSRNLHAGVVQLMVESMARRDPATARHSAAVARLSRATAAAAGLSTSAQELVHTAGLLHDVGKVGFPDETLTAAPLTQADWALIRAHPQRGAELVGQVHGFEEVAELVLSAHERIDGRGYPRGLAGEQIPELARIIAITETFHAMTAHDSYREPVGYPEALNELRRVAGTQLDIRLVEIFIGVINSSGVDLEPADSTTTAWRTAAR